MVDLVVYALGVLVFFVAVGLFSRWLEHRSDARERFEDAPFVALRSPSRTHAFDRRIEAALREASRGFRLCSKCLFTNRSRAESCVLCGCGLGDAKSTKGDEHPQLSRRQRRARTRKRWVRRIRPDGGDVVWSCSTEEATVMSPFYVLRMMPAAQMESELIERQDNVSRAGEATPDAVSVQIDGPEHTMPAPTLDTVGTALRDEVAHVMFDATVVRNGSPAPLHVRMTHTTATSTTGWKDAVASAESDFPTKLAQFVTSTSAVFLSAALNDGADGTTRSTRLDILREDLLATSIEALATMDCDHARAVIRVDFAGEQGIDAGGVYREWFVLLNEQILAPSAGLFVCVDPSDQVFYLNPHSQEVLGENHLAHFLAVGRLVGRALLDGNVTGFHLALPLLKIILGEPIGFPELEYFDPEVFRNLQWLLDNDNVEALGLDFTVIDKLPDGSTRVVELIPNGADVDVNDTNKRQFVDRKLQYLLFESVHHQLFAFLKGIYDVVPPELIVLLDAEELDYLVAGSDEIDVDDWERNSQTTGNLLLHPALPNFWKVVRELSLDERRRLLQFATGSTRVPPGGFASLTSFDGRQCAFTLHGTAVWRLRGYLRAHACFNRLDLPLHFDLPTMRRAVAAAIAVDAFGFTSS